MTKRWLISIAALAALAFTGSICAQTIDGTSHDLGGTTGGDGNQICAYCHTPHNATVSTSPLWNRNDPATGTYTMYSSPTLDMDINGVPEGVSLACLSCHDGTIALDSMVNTPTGWTPEGDFIATAGEVGPDLSGDHPISIAYDTTADTAFNGQTGGKVGTLQLFNGTQSTTQVECASCHSVHDNSNAPFLRMSNGNSALCLACHIK